MPLKYAVKVNPVEVDPVVEVDPIVEVDPVVEVVDPVEVGPVEDRDRRFVVVISTV